MLNIPFLFSLLLGSGLLGKAYGDPDFTKVAGFGNATVRYKQVPDGICETLPGVKSYSGYVDISDHEHMFFWFFEARNGDPKNAPLTAWISGGPGDSSMAELFTEHGACRIEPDGKTVVFNPFSWTNHSNVIYIDQPIQVGFSYTDLVEACECSDNDDGDSTIVTGDKDSCPDGTTASECGMFSEPDTSKTANSTINAAPVFWTVLQSFMAAFPNYSKNGFHFGSESYGGHYVPVFSDYILKQNDKDIKGAQKIDLRSILVGNGWFSPELQYESYYHYGYNPGTPYDLGNVSDAETESAVYHSLYGKDRCLDQLKKCQASGTNETCQKADQFCDSHVSKPWTDDSGVNNNDVREQDPSPFPNDFYADYLQLDSVREAIGAVQTYIELNPTVGEAFDSTGDDGRELGIINILGDLVKKGIRVTLFAGDSDYECNWLGIEAVANSARVAGFDQAGYVNVSTPDCIVRGEVKQSGIFSFIRVYEAGHAVGAFQPLMQQTIFARTISGMDIATGLINITTDYKTQGSKNSTYREGNATVQTKQVQSNATYNYTSNLPSYDDFQPTWNSNDACQKPSTSQASRLSPSIARSWRNVVNRIV